MKGLRELLDEGAPLFGPGVFSGDPMVVEMIGYLGFDFVFIDTEQAPPSPSGRDLEHLVRAADAAGVIPTVRIGEVSPYSVNNALNLGAKALWAPHVESAEEARSLVSWSRYPPVGTRGAAPIVRGARYGLDGFDAYRRRADGETVLIAIVESVAGVENVEEIAAVPGLDAVCFGAFDFAVSLGLGQDDFYGGEGDDGVDGRVREAGERCLRACLDTGTIPVGAAWSETAAELWIELGYKMLLYGLDTALLLAALRDLRAQTERLKHGAR